MKKPFCVLHMRKLRFISFKGHSVGFFGNMGLISEKVLRKVSNSIVFYKLSPEKNI